MTSTTAPTTAPTTVHLVLLDGLADWEVGHLTAHLRSLRGEPGEPRYRLATVAVDAAPVTTAGGLRVVPDLVLADLDPAESAMLVLPGGAAWHTPAAEPFVALAARFLEAGVPVAAICGATFGLAAAGLLDGRRHTSNDPAYLAASGYGAGDLYVDEPAVVDGDLVTASGVAPVHFARAVFERLGAHDVVLVDPWTRLHLERDPAAFHELMSA